MWAKQARKAGVTPPEIVEAIVVSRLMKSATVNDTAADAWRGWAPRGPDARRLANIESRGARS